MLLIITLKIFESEKIFHIIKFLLNIEIFIIFTCVYDFKESAIFITHKGEREREKQHIFLKNIKKYHAKN